MSKRVYALRILVETDEDMETVESHIRGWGEATFEGFILLELTRTRASLVDIDTLSHVIANSVKSQEATQEALGETICVLRDTNQVLRDTEQNLRQIVSIFSSEKSSCQTEEPETEETQNETTSEDI